MCGRDWPDAGRCAKYVPKSKIVNRLLSILAQGFADAALGELVLAHYALGVDPQQHVDAVPGPFGDLGRVDAAVQPRGEAGVPEVVGPPGERRGLLRRREDSNPDPDFGGAIDGDFAELVTQLARIVADIIWAHAVLLRWIASNRLKSFGEADHSNVEPASIRQLKRSRDEDLNLLS